MNIGIGDKVKVISCCDTKGQIGIIDSFKYKLDGTYALIQLKNGKKNAYNVLSLELVNKHDREEEIKTDNINTMEFTLSSTYYGYYGSKTYEKFKNVLDNYQTKLIKNRLVITLSSLSELCQLRDDLEKVIWSCYAEGIIIKKDDDGNDEIEIYDGRRE